MHHGALRSADLTRLRSPLPPLSPCTHARTHSFCCAGSCPLACLMYESVTCFRGHLDPFFGCALIELLYVAKLAICARCGQPIEVRFALIVVTGLPESVAASSVPTCVVTRPPSPHAVQVDGALRRACQRSARHGDQGEGWPRLPGVRFLPALCYGTPTETEPSVVPFRRDRCPTLLSLNHHTLCAQISGPTIVPHVPKPRRLTEL